MSRIAAIFLVLFLLAVPAISVSAQDNRPCQFVRGFATLRDLIGHGIVGACLENEHYNAAGDSVQQTTGGLLVWRKADNWTAFTDGYRTWINGPHGLQQRLNTERFPWEPDYAPGGGIATPTPTPVPPPTPTPRPTATPRPMIDPVLGRALQVMRRTETGASIYNMFAHTGASVVFGRTRTYAAEWHLSPARIVVSNTFRQESPEALAYLLIWPITWLYNYQDFVADSGSNPWGTCMLMEYISRRSGYWYWLEAFGVQRNPATDVEEYATNRMFEWAVLGSEDAQMAFSWLETSDREFCEQFGTPSQYVDPQLARAYRLAMFAGGGDGPNGLGVATAGVIMGTKVNVVFGNLPSSINGRFEGRRIVINQRLRNQDADVLAAVLIHETYHAAGYVDRGYAGWETAAECLQEEVDAFRLTARWWYDVHGRHGKRSPNSAERFRNAVMRAWINDDLKEWVLLSDSYQEQCLGGTVN